MSKTKYASTLAVVFSLVFACDSSLHAVDLLRVVLKDGTVRYGVKERGKKTAFRPYVKGELKEPEPWNSALVDTEKRVKIAFADNLTKAAVKLTRSCQTGTVVILPAVSYVDDNKALTKATAAIDRFQTDMILRQGCRGAQPAKTSVTPDYRNHRLASKLLFSNEDLVAWKRTGYTCALQTIVRERNGRIRVAWQWFSIARGKPAGKVTFPEFYLRDLDIELSKPLLPKLNRGLLLFAANNLGKKIGKGECWDLPAQWLKKRGEKVRGYDFGKEVPLEEALPGDVLTNDDFGNHHVMLLVRPTPGLLGALIYHQNTGGARYVVADVMPRGMIRGVKVWRPGQ